MTMIFVFTLFASCTKKVEEEPFVLVIDENTLRVYIDVYDRAREYASSFETLNKRAWEAGFGVVFTMYERDQYYYGIDPNKNGLLPNYPSYEDYLSEYRKHVEANLSDNAVYIIDSRYQEFIDGLYYGGKLGDHSETGGRIAPEYMLEPQVARYNGLSDGETYSLPLYFEERNSGTLAVLVREGIAEDWGDEIRTGSQFEDFLAWRLGKKIEEMSAGVKQAKPRPCVIPYTLGEYWPYNLYLPELGYAPVGVRHSEYVVLDLNDDSIVGVGEQGVFDEILAKRRELPGRMLIDNVGIQGMDGLIVLEPVEAYDAALIFIDDYNDHYFGDYTGGNDPQEHHFPVLTDNFFIKTKFNYTDLSGYRMYILYNDSLPEIVWGRGVGDAAYQQAISGKEADAAEFLRLLHWLYNKKNYMKLFFGNLGEDYTIEERRVVMSGPDEDAHIYWQLLSIFRRSGFMPVMSTAPSNFEAETEALKYSRRITISDDDSSTLGDIFESGLDSETIVSTFKSAFDRAVVEY